MSVIGRQRQQVSLRFSAPSVEDAVATMRSRRQQAAQHRLLLKARDDGRFTARIPGSRSSSPPSLRGRFEAGDGGVVLEGVITEARASVGIPRGFTGMAAVLAAVAVLLAVAGQPAPGSYICGGAAVLFWLIGYGLSRLRAAAFRYDCKNLMGKLTPLLPGANPIGDDPAGARHLP